MGMRGRSSGGKAAKGQELEEEEKEKAEEEEEEGVRESKVQMVDLIWVRKLFSLSQAGVSVD